MAVVYRHRRLDTNKIFYVGMGNKEKRAYSLCSRNQHWINIVNKADYRVEVIAKDINYEDASELECFLIQLYGRKDLGTGILVNMTEGGGSIMGYKRTKELVDRIANSKRGSKMSDESKEKMSISQKGRKHPEYVKDKISRSNIGKTKSEEHKLKLSKSVEQSNLEGAHIGSFKSINDAQENTNVSQSSITNVCKDKNKTAGGYIWLYTTEYEKDKSIILLRLKNVTVINSKGVTQLDLDGNHIKDFNSTKEVIENVAGINKSNISATLTGRTKTTKGYRWIYTTEYKKLN